MFPNPPDENAPLQPQAPSTRRYARPGCYTQSRAAAVCIVPRGDCAEVCAVTQARTRDAAQVAMPPSRMATQLSSVRRTQLGSLICAEC